MKVRACIAVVALVLVGLALCASLRSVRASEVTTAAPRLNNPDAACAACHRAIYESYEHTSMARGSGLATDALQTGTMHHGPSNIDYRVFLRDGSAWMSFVRGAPEASLQGERQLLYYIGSGRRGRTYLYQTGEQWFELPINFYTRRGVWDMAPAFDHVQSMPAVLPVDPNCLHCHATQVQASLPSARNRFAGQPFQQGGIGCSACHGDPTEHLARQGYGAILNPNKLAAARRDSVCTQCHLEGETVVYRAGRSLAQFRPGEDLAETAVYFVREERGAEKQRATSQYEALLRSACKRGSGERLTCTTCHDPHSSPSAAERVPYFRARCLSCHTDARIAREHHPEQQDCAVCHMPTRDSSDISHEQVTDHDIETRPSVHDGGRGDALVTVGGVTASEAEYGMAYAQLAARGGAAYRKEALRGLAHAAEAGPLEPAMEAQLGYLLQLDGRMEAARAAYVEALRRDPYQPTALGNLGVLDAASGQIAEAMRLLEKLVEADPSQTPAGLNLAWIECKLGRRGEGRQVLERLRKINPDDPQLRIFEGTGNYLGQHCALSDPAPR